MNQTHPNQMSNLNLLTLIRWRTGLGGCRLPMNTPVPVCCGHLNPQYTHVECRG